MYVILMIAERSAHGQSDINLGHKGQAVADTKIKTDINLGHKGQAGGRHQNKPTKKLAIIASFFLFLV